MIYTLLYPPYQIPNISLSHIHAQKSLTVSSTICQPPRKRKYHWNPFGSSKNRSQVRGGERWRRKCVDKAFQKILSDITKKLFFFHYSSKRVDVKTQGEEKSTDFYEFKGKKSTGCHSKKKSRPKLSAFKDIMMD